MMETGRSFTDRIGAQAALYIVCTCCISYWFYWFIGFGFLFGVFFGIGATVVFQFYIVYKLFNYEDYLKTSKNIEDNRQFWNDRISGYQELIEKDISELGRKVNTEAKESYLINSDFSFSDDEDMNENILSKKQMFEKKVIEKSLHDLNDKNSNIMLASGYTSLFKKESMKMLNRVNHKNEDKNFEVQFHSRLRNAENYIQFFIKYYTSVSEVEFQMNFK